MKSNFILALVFFSMTFSLYAAGFSTVKNNEIEMSDYTYDDFKNEFNIGMRFLSIEPNRWKTNVKDCYEVTAKNVLKGTVKLELRVGIDLISENYIEVKAADLKDFRKSFIERKGLCFENGFPVKVLKVKTAVGDEIEFFSSPGGTEKIQSKASENVIYYPFKQRTLANGEKWLYVANSTTIDLGVEKDIENKTIGWVKYIDEKGNKMNVVLWNTNLGILPEYKESYNKYPLVFKKNASYTNIVGYYLNAIPQDRNELLTDENNIKGFIQRIQDRRGNVDRWLPMYNPENTDPFTISVGVLDSMAIVKQSLVEVVTAEQIRVAVLVDETLSMKKVWEKLDKVLIQVLKTVSGAKFKNLQEEEIITKIRLYAFADECRLINKDRWISTPEDVANYSNNITNIANNLVNSANFEPKLLDAVRYVINDKGIKNNPVLLVVIGDCGDYQSESSFKDLMSKDASKQLIYDISGVLFKSEPNNKTPNAIAIYEKGHAKFKKNLDMIAEIKPTFSTELEVNDLGKKIGNDIVSNIEATITAFDTMIAKEKAPVETKERENLSVFASRYLLELTTQLQNKSENGTYFEEGKLFYRPSDPTEKLYRSYVFIEKNDLENFKSSLINFINNRGKQEFRDMMRDILATFFGKNIHYIQDDFLKSTTIYELWEIVVGNQELAKKLMPNLFSVRDTNFYTLIESYNPRMENIIIENVTGIRNRLDRLQNDATDKTEIVVYKGNTPEYKTYFWVEADDINIFKGLLTN